VAALPVYLAALTFELRGFLWSHALQRPELLVVAALALLPLAHRAVPELAAVARGVLLVLALFPLLVLSSVEGLSLIPADPGVMLVAYQVLAFVAGCVVIGIALARGLTETLVIGCVFAGLFIVTRFVDWWWDWMPKYLFFLIMAAVAIGSLYALRLARRRLEGAA
jgi:hypothetical protein